MEKNIDEKIDKKMDCKKPPINCKKIWEEKDKRDKKQKGRKER